MTPVFVLTINDIIGLSLLGLFVLAFGYVFVSILVADAWSKLKRHFSKGKSK